MSPAIQDYLEAMHHLAPASLRSHRLWLSHFEGYCQKRGLQWKRCRPKDLEQFRQALLWQPNRRLGQLYSSNSVDLGLRVLRHFYRWASQAQLVLTNPMKGWSLSYPIQPDQPVLAQEQVLALFNLPDLSQPQGTRDQLFLELLYDLTLSLAECRALRLDQVEADHLELGDRRLELDSVRPALERYLALGRPRLVKVPRRVRAPTPFLLLSDRGKPYLSDMGLGTRLYNYGKQLGLAQALCARTLHRSHRAQIDQLARRHSQTRARMVD